MSTEYVWSNTSEYPPPNGGADVEGGDGSIADLLLQPRPIPPSRLDPFIGEQMEWPTPATSFTVEDTDVLGLLRGTILTPPVTRAPWTPDQDDLPLNTAVDDGGWTPFFTVGTTGTVTIGPSAWENDEVVPAVQPTAPPTEDWNPLPLMGVPVAPTPLSLGPDFWKLDEFLPSSPLDEEWYELPRYFVVRPAPQRPVEWSWINQLVPTQPSAPAQDEPGSLDALLRVTPPVYTVYDRFVWELDQGTPVLVPVVADIVDSPTRLLVLNHQSTVLLVLDHHGNPMTRPLIITAGETGPLRLACAGRNLQRQDLTGATCTLRLVNNNGTVYADAVSVTIEDEEDGVVIWTRQTAQVSTAGDYQYQIKAVLSDGSPVYFPDSDPLIGNPLTILKAL